MANARIFVSFAIEDETTKILFTGQAKHDKVPYEFTDMSVKKPWDSQWKTNCRSRIKGCDGVIVLITKHLKKADGAIWEIKCAKEEKVPILGVYMKGTTIADTPDELDGIKKVNWTWSNIAEFVNKF
jgi:CTP synthase (UTP-ammonia lyase)